MRALGLLRHRGPFGKGEAAFELAWMGMTRLPMSSAQPFELPLRRGRWAASYNGEVYGDGAALDLRGEVDCLLESLDSGRYPDGMYALAAYDTERQVLHLVRDPAGIKPLYVHEDVDRGRLHFASELPALLALIGPAALDKDVLAELVVAGVPLDCGTPFSGVRLLEPGTALRVELMPSGRLRTVSTRLRTGAAPTGETLAERLDVSVQRCGETFRELGLLVSGGLDSSLLDAVAPASMPRFHVAVDGEDDRPVHAGGLRLTRLGEDEFWPTAREAVRRFAMPTRMSSLVMYQRLADLVEGAGVHGVLIGEGADEVFWGYPRHLDFLAAGGRLDARGLAQAYFGDIAAKAAALLNPAAARRLADHAETIAAGALEQGVEAAVGQFDLAYSLEPLLRRADHLLMGGTIESRLPYLHNGLPAWGRALGLRNVAGGRQKAALSDLVRERLPTYPQDRRKRHFRVPFDRWPRVAAQMRAEIRSQRDVLAALGLMPPSDAALETMDSNLLFTLVTAVLWRSHFGDLLA